MKKSTQVPASLIVALAGIAATGCSGGSYDECVDATGRVIAMSACRGGSSGAYIIRRNVQSGGFGGSGGSSGGFFGG